MPTLLKTLGRIFCNGDRVEMLLRFGFLGGGLTLIYLGFLGSPWPWLANVGVGASLLLMLLIANRQGGAT